MKLCTWPLTLDSKVPPRIALMPKSPQTTNHKTGLAAPRTSTALCDPQHPRMESLHTGGEWHLTGVQGPAGLDSDGHRQRDYVACSYPSLPLPHFL